MRYMVLEYFLVWSVTALIKTDATTPRPTPANEEGPPAVVAQSSPSGKLRISWTELSVGLRPELEYVVHYTIDPGLPISKWSTKVTCNTDTTMLDDLVLSTAYSVRLEARLKNSDSPWPVYMDVEVKPEPDDVIDISPLESQPLMESNVTVSEQDISLLNSRIERMEKNILERFAKLESLLAKVDSRMDLLEDVAKALSTGNCELQLHAPRRMTCII